jgi:hypothetical protein
MRNINLYKKINKNKYQTLPNLIKEVDHDNGKFKLNFNYPIKELIFAFNNSRLNRDYIIENNDEDVIENNEDIQINEIIYLDIKTIFIINKYIGNENIIYI